MTQTAGPVGRRVRLGPGAAGPALAEEEVGPPGPGEVRLRQTALGLDRCGLHLPGGDFTPGVAAAGVVEAVGSEVEGVAPGDRLCYADLPGAWRSLRNLPAARLVPIPGDVEDAVAAALVRRGLAAHYLLRRLHRAQPGERLLVLGAAGGVGRLLCQWAAMLGAEVAGQVSDPDKAEAARAHGCREVVVAPDDRPLAAAVREQAGEGGFRVAYDPAGGERFAECLDCLAPTGMAVGYGALAGPPPPLDLERLEARSLRLARPTLAAWIAGRDDLLAASEELFELIGAGRLRPGPLTTFPLAESAAALAHLRNRRTLTAAALMV